MRIEFLEDVKDAGECFDKDDVKANFDDERGKRFVLEGWAKDLDGKVETGERTPGPASIDVEGASHKQSAKKA